VPSCFFQGFQVSPAELEGHLLTQELVQDVAVVGKQHVRCGEVPIAFVVLSALGATLAAHSPNSVKESIRRHVQDTKSSYKWLHAVHFVESIPKLASGKILIKKLKEVA